MTDVDVVKGAPVAIPQVTESQLADVVRAETDFGLDVLGEVATGSGNTVMSPSSLGTVLAMIAPGARGDTAEELKRVLHMPGDPASFAAAIGSLERASARQAVADEFTLTISNDVWTQQGCPFEPGYLGLLAAAFDTGAHTVDFGSDPEAARHAINAEVARETAGKIKDLFGAGQINLDTVLVLTDAIYFHAKWETRFKAGDTRPADFHIPDGPPTRVPTMHQTSTLPYAAGDGWQAVELPYLGGHFALDIVMPGGESIERFGQSLDADKLGSVLGSLRRRRVALALPKFTFESTFQLNETLAALGMPTAFGPRADFTGISEILPFLDIIVQKAIVAVDEEGTTAAAATGAAVTYLAMVRAAEPLVFNVDRPFLFALRDRTSGRVHFFGQVTDPR